MKKSNKKHYDGGVGGDFSSDGPLHSNYDQGSLNHEFSGFDSGDFGGAGAGGDWGASSDGGDSGSCSGCSGGCGGGGD
ncbi:MAG TPA: hypothetical protein VFH07_00800 [Chitinophagaceae bacterium]|jgi:hypothetical protein|nr:hypothetical protein [Chitinophagaceae bacterium]